MKRLFTFTKHDLAAMVVTFLVGSILTANALTDEEAYTALEKAAEHHESGPTTMPEQATLTVEKPDIDPSQLAPEDMPKTLKNDPDYMAGVRPQEVPLEKIPLTVNYENMRLEDVLASSVRSIEKQTGPWRVKWRVKPDHEHVKDELVNVIAEASFGDFLTYLTDRVRNLTGVQLFVSTFNESRIMIISDTYH